jgi:hypothetical protein
MLNEILEKLIISSPVFDPLVHLKDSLDMVQVASWFNMTSWFNMSADIAMLKVQAPLIFDAHIVEDDTIGHGVDEGLFVPETSRALTRAKPSLLANVKTSLNVFPASL